MARAFWKKYTLRFRQPSGTSRGVLREKHSWFLLWDEEGFHYPAVGECSIIEGLSPEPPQHMGSKLGEVCAWLNKQSAEQPDLAGFPSIRFGLEALLADIAARGSKILFTGSFTSGQDAILINGLVWMGDPDFMKHQIRQKVEAGFRCIKLKIGALDFEQELDILRWVRSEFSSEALELRVDANGAFTTNDALEKLRRLSAFHLHSIEQPIAVRQWSDMATLCEHSPIPIALDEELIHVEAPSRKEQLLDELAPQFIVLKPSLVGGLKSCDQWIASAEARGIGWWITSALESNIGLNAISQYAFVKRVELPQGLGTGGLYTNNLKSPLYIEGQFIRFDPERSWDVSPLLNE